MSSRSTSPSWKKQIEEKLAAVEESLKLEREERQQKGALDDEELELHSERMGRIENEQQTWIGRVAWLERHLPKGGRPRARRRRKTAR